MLKENTFKVGYDETEWGVINLSLTHILTDIVVTRRLKIDKYKKADKDIIYNEMVIELSKKVKESNE